MVMSQAAAPVAHLTWNEICVRYPNRWLALAPTSLGSTTPTSSLPAPSSSRRSLTQSGDADNEALHTVERSAVGCFWTGEILRGGVGSALGSLRR